MGWAAVLALRQINTRDAGLVERRSSADLGEDIFHVYSYTEYIYILIYFNFFLNSNDSSGARL